MSASVHSTGAGRAVVPDEKCTRTASPGRTAARLPKGGSAASPFT